MNGLRVKELRKTLNLSQKDFGEKIGLKSNTISDIENGKYNLTESNIKLICKEFHVEYIWLTTGQGDMFISDSDKDNEDYQVLIDNIMTGENEFHKNLFKTFATLDSSELQILENIINKFLKIKESKE